MRFNFKLNLFAALLFPSSVDGVVASIPWLRAHGDTLVGSDLYERSRRLDQNTENDSDEASFDPIGVIDLDFNPGFVISDEFYSGPGLVVSSFHNVGMNPAMLGGPNVSAAPGASPFIPFERDLVAVLNDLDSGEPIVERLDVKAGVDFVWPNEARRAPDGMFPFEAVVVPQGWFTMPIPGRLVVFSLGTDDVIVIHQSTEEDPRFYHSVHFVDMDQDGALDIVTARSGYQVGSTFHPPVGELVWFRNPGAEEAISRQTADLTWEEFIIVDGLGPDVFLDVKDITGDGIPEIVTNHFFAGMPAMHETPWYSPSRVTLYGAPEGENWASVDSASQLRVADLVDDQGMMFSVEIVDLNGDGAYDILTTNHQLAIDPLDGRVLALEPPESGRIFDDPWTVHHLMQGIRPTNAPPGQPSFRMAPGAAKSFHIPHGNDNRPWIAVSGDQASKAWVLKPTSDPWVYDEELLLDINVYYGENATNTMLLDPFGITISTIGQIGIREEHDQVMLYVPVFEATDIHIFRTKNDTKEDENEHLIVAESINSVDAEIAEVLQNELSAASTRLPISFVCIISAIVALL
jgi:hypothetical protein